jgi:hypothetical protein
MRIGLLLLGQPLAGSASGNQQVIAFVQAPLASLFTFFFPLQPANNTRVTVQGTLS